MKRIWLIIISVFALFVIAFSLTNIIFDEDAAKTRAKYAFQKEKTCYLNKINELQRDNNEYTRLFGEGIYDRLANVRFEVSDVEDSWFSYTVKYRLYSGTELVDNNEMILFSFGLIHDKTPESSSNTLNQCTSECNSDVPSYDRQLCYDACDTFVEAIEDAGDKCSISFSLS